MLALAGDCLNVSGNRCFCRRMQDGLERKVLRAFLFELALTHSTHVSATQCRALTVRWLQQGEDSVVVLLGLSRLARAGLGSWTSLGGNVEAF